MKKAYITLCKKGGNVSAVGYVDLDKKVLYIPKIGKKGTCYIDEVVVNYINKKDTDTYFGIEIITLEDGTTYIHNYLINLSLDKKGETK